MEEFAVRLVDPLKSDDGHREMFRAGIDHFADQAIEGDQKKVKILKRELMRLQNLKSIRLADQCSIQWNASPCKN